MDISALAKKIQDGDVSLYEELWKGIKGLVVFFAKKFYYVTAESGNAPGGVELEDLIQEGYIAMTEAIEVFDDEKGAFSTILTYYLKKRFEIAAGFHGKKNPLDRALSLDLPMRRDDPEGDALLDLIPDRQDMISALEDHIFIEELRDALEDALGTLPDQEAAAIKAEFMQEKTGNVIAEEMGIPYNDFRKLRANAWKHIRREKNLLKLEAFLDRETDFYLGMGYRAYYTTQTSGVERKVIYRDNLRKQHEEKNL